jgi:hypothetical protein
MGYFIKDIADKYGLKSTREQAWGTINGFWFQIQFKPSPQQKTQMFIHTAVRYPGDEGKALIWNVSQL